MRTDKEVAIRELSREFRNCDVIVAGYRGLTTAQLSGLRHALRAEASLRVVKNTLASLAAAEEGITLSSLAGPTALAFVDGDAARAARVLAEFSKATPALDIKGGVLSHREITADDVSRLAGLGSREEVLGRLAGAMTALPARMAQLAEALRAKL